MVAVGLIPLLHLGGQLSFPVLLRAGGRRRAGCAGPATGRSTRSCRRSPAAPRCPSSASPGWPRPSSARRRLAGAAMAGALVAFAGAANALIVDAVSFGVCAAVFAWSTARHRRAAERVVERPAGRRRTSRELREGWTFLRKRPGPRRMSGMVAVTNLLDLAWSRRCCCRCGSSESGYSVGVMGAYFAAWAAASAIGSFVAAWAAERLPRFQVYSGRSSSPGCRGSCCSRSASRCGWCSPRAWSAASPRGSSTRSSGP